MTSAMRMVLCSLLLYSCCYLPYFVSKLFDFLRLNGIYYSRLYIDWTMLDYMLKFLPLANSCFSPCIYIAFLSDFRQAAKRLFCERTTNRRNSVRQQTMQRREIEIQNEGAESESRRRNSHPEDEHHSELTTRM